MPRLANLTTQSLAGIGITRGPYVELLYTLTNPNTGGGTSTSDEFGATVRMTNNYIAVAAPNENTNSGYVYVYDASNGSLLYTLANPNTNTTNTNDAFGENKIDINGDRLIVGAKEEDSGAGTSSGVAYVYDLTDGSLTYTLTNPNQSGTEDFDQFGHSVAIDGTYALAGTPFEDAPSNNSSGVAYVYALSTGTRTRTIVNPNTTFTQYLDSFGSAIETNGTLWAIAAWSEDNPTNASGVVYIYNTSGVRQRTIPNPRSDSIALGQNNKMDIDGNNILIASQNYAHVIDITDGSTLATLGPFGFISTVSISGDYALMGISTGDGYIADLYDWTTNTKVMTLDLGSRSINARQCFVHMNGTQLVIGDSLNNQAFVYQINT